MMLAMALRYRTGVVLCADCLVADGDARYGQAFGRANKMEWFLTGPKSSAAICGSASDLDVVRPVVQAIESKFWRATPNENPSIRDVLELELDTAYFESVMPQMELLVVQTTVGISSPLIYKCSGPHIAMAAPFECIGIADNPLVCHLADSVIDEGASREYAVVLGIYLAQLGKRHVPRFVGGQTEVLVASDGCCKEIAREKVQELESRLESAVGPLKAALEEISGAV
jgi:hypothetical protein